MLKVGDYMCDLHLLFTPSVTTVYEMQCRPSYRVSQTSLCPVSVSFIHSNQRDVGTRGTMHELVIT